GPGLPDPTAAHRCRGSGRSVVAAVQRPPVLGRAGRAGGPRVAAGRRRPSDAPGGGGAAAPLNAIATRALTKRYGDITAVDGLDLAVEQGVLYGFLGPNGAGKTTAIRMALGLIFPTGGAVEVLGEPVFSEG